MVCVEVSRGTAYGIGFSQVAIILGVLLYSPPLIVIVFTNHPPVVNGTLDTTQPHVIHTMKWNVALPLLCISGLTAMFSTTTMNLHNDGMGGMDYQHDTIEQYAMWDLAFWLYCFFIHMLVIVALTSPVDLFAMLMSTTFMVYFLHRACAPKSQQVNITQENMNILGYCIGVLIAAYSIPNQNTSRMSALFVLVFFDYFVGIGHTWDRMATLDTITNCRLFYTTVVSLFLATMYAIWGDTFANA